MLESLVQREVEERNNLMASFERARLELLRLKQSRRKYTCTVQYRQCNGLVLGSVVERVVCWLYCSRGMYIGSCIRIRPYCSSLGVLNLSARENLSTLGMTIVQAP